jgi:hypothetical protein
MWSFHVTHHVFHSFLLPRVAFTTELESNNQLEGTKSRFIWWAEGWAQYLALSKVAKWFDIQDAQLFFAHRFASSPAAVNSSLAVWSLEQYVNQTQWFPLFGAGAMLALKVSSLFLFARLIVLC